MLKRCLVIIFLLFPLFAIAEDFVVGKDYELLSASKNTSPSRQNISVKEFFSYGCPWCYRIDNSLRQWVTQQGEKIEFSRIPVIFNREWILYAKAYYTAKYAGVEASVSPALFKAIQEDKKTLTNTEAMINFLKTQGIDVAIAKSAFEHSTTIDLQLKESANLMTFYHINAIPALIINNEYKVDLQMAGSEERLFKILDFLVTKARSI